MDEIENIKQAMAALEAQRPALGDQVLLTCWQVLQAANDSRSAHLLSEAHRLLQEQAGRHPAGPMREAYLHNIPSHRALLALVAASTASADSAEGGDPGDGEDTGVGEDTAWIGGKA